MDEEEKIIPGNTGVIEDPRTEEEKEKDYSHEEIAHGVTAPVVWPTKQYPNFNYYSKRNQSMSLSCMAQAGVKALGVENYKEEQKFIDFSALDPYDRRVNKPGGGMWGQNLMNILSTNGACLESQLPSQGFGETMMNREVVRTPEMIEVAKKYRGGGYVEVKLRDIDAVASVIAQGKPVILVMYFDAAGTEWWREVPQINVPNLGLYDDAAIRHGITAVDFTMYNGKKALIIDDSAGNWSSINQGGQRVLTEDFFNKRCYYAAYFLPLANEGGYPKPVHTFNIPLRFGMMANAEVKNLQAVLYYEGFLKIKPTGNYLEQTAAALLKWQKAHNVAPDSELNPLKGKSFGPKSRAVANGIYSN